jgi:aspartate/methionine/tyrosine aminotransferase
VSGPSPSRYPIAAIRERVRDFAGPLLDFAVGRHTDPTPPELHALLEREASSLLISGTACGEHDTFHEAAAAMLRRVYGIEVGPEAVLLVPGGRTAMSFLVTAATQPDDVLLVTEPAYPAMGRIASQLRPRTAAVALDPDRGFAPALDEVPAATFERLRFVALNYPNNPTGATVPAAVIDDLAHRLAAGTLLFNDATYGPLTFDGPPWSLLAIAGDRHPGLRLLELHSLAKLYGVGPVPISFLAGDPGTVAGLRELSEFAWSDQSSLAIRIATRCLADGDQLAAMRDLYRRRLAALRAAVEALGFAAFPPAGGMYLLCRAPRAVAGVAVATAGEAADRLLADYAIAVVPWEAQPRGYLRFSGRYRPQDLEALIAIGNDGPIVLS